MIYGHGFLREAKNNEMSVQEIRKEVKRMCKDAGLEFFFVCSSPNASEWSVTDCGHIRKLVNYHKKLEAAERH